jgi:uncharacterized protein (TIGR00255 family)
MAELLSMTGYGSAKGVVEGLEVTVELKSVNNRYLDCNVRMPRNFLFAEETVKQAVSASVGRGKVDVFVSSASSANSDMTVAINHELAKGYFDAVSSIAKELGIETGLTANQIARYPDVLVLEKREMDKEVAAKELYDVAEAAVAEFNKMRAREGQRLKEDMLSKLESIESLVGFVETRSPQIVEEYRHRLEAKLREVLEEKALDEHRMVTEAAIFADRTAVDEETVRLRSHISQFRQMLDGGSPVGRKLDFLIQEFNRESNTIGSKCNDATLARVVVDLKSEIEKIREQVQNIE